MNKIEYLVVSSTIDFSTDLICCRLMEDDEKYYRLNRDELSKHEIVIDMQKRRMSICVDDDIYIAGFESLRGIYFRAPVFYRTQSKGILSVDEQLERNQWSAFLRNLIVFEKAIWINHPVEIYRAENKMYQLLKAEESGLNIPKTCVANTINNEICNKEKMIVKSIDTALFFDVEKSQELFTYSNVINKDDLKNYEFSLAPIFFQEFLNPKVDIRVTYVDGRMFPVKITKDNAGLYGDWRLFKEELSYIPIHLNDEIQNRLRILMGKLNLRFGGIDLAIVNNEYYFIEVNPTGEWGWLENNTGIQISMQIKRSLTGERDVWTDNSDN